MIWTAKKKMYRVYTALMKVVSKILNFPAPALLTGPGSVKLLAENIKALGIRNLLFVTDENLTKLKLTDSLLRSLEEHGISYTLFNDVQPNPTIENVEAGVKVYRDNKCAAIVAFGGGSPIDCAKIIGARVANPFMKVRMMKGLFKVFIPIPPLFCIPTTAGTGSETTVVAVITDAEKHEKFAISNSKLIPKIAVLDPELMIGLPPHITSTTGMDALTHAVEAYVGLLGNELTDENAEKAVKLIFENLEKAYWNGKNMEARSNMALASFYGGAAFTRASVGYVHAIAHNIGALYNVPHGLANAVILPYVLDFYGDSIADKLASLAIKGGLGKVGEPASELSRRFISHIKELNEKMSIPTYIHEIKEGDVSLIAKRVLNEAHPKYPVPKIMNEKECREIIQKLLAP